MAFPSVTNTFVNGPSNIIDATEVNTNFNDIVNGFSDGSKDLNMSSGTFAALAVSGATTFSGAVAAGTTLTVTGATTLSSTLAVDGTVTMASTLQVTGAVQMDSTLAVTGAVTAAGMTTAGSITMSGGNFKVENGHIYNTYTSGSIYTTGATGHIYAVNGNIYATNGNMSCGGTITATSTVKGSSFSNTAGTTTVGTNIISGGNIYTTANIYSTGGSLFVSGSGHMYTGSGNIYTTSGNIYATAGNITATAGNVVAGGDVYTTAFTNFSLAGEVGWSGTPTTTLKYKKVGNLVYVWVKIVGSSDNLNTYFNLPVTPHADMDGMHCGGGAAYSGAAWADENLTFEIDTGNSRVYCDLNGNQSVWASTGLKWVYGSFFYEAA